MEPVILRGQPPSGSGSGSGSGYGDGSWEDPNMPETEE